MKNYFLLFIILTTAQIYAQRNQGGFNGGTVTGKVLDFESKHIIEYANIVLLSTKDSSLINGTITDVNGIFNLSKIKPDKYLLEVRFIGYETEKFDIDINPNNLVIDLGEITIKPSALELGDVVVQGERSPVSYQIDKKVIDVDKIQTVISGNAADVLQNVPSVTVDIEGNVSLRGSTNFTVLIDGRPSIMSAQDALQQIPASSIQNIEIITNPSAKYNPEGTSGIINILLKKNENLGLSGVMNANAGLKDKYGGDFLFQYRTNDLVYILGMDYNKRIFPGTSNSENRYITSNSTSYINSNGDSEWGRIGFGVRAGIEYNITENDFFNFTARYGTREGKQNSILNYIEGSSISIPVLSYKNFSDRSREGKYGGTNLTYIHNFGSKGHEVKSEFNFRYNDGDESTLTKALSNDLILKGKKTTEFGPSRDFEVKIDYTLPFTDERKFEAGYDAEIENSDDNNSFYLFDSLSYDFQFQKQFSHDVKYLNNDQALYATYTDQFGDFGIQGGFRAEYTFRTISLLDINAESKINRWDYFPTLHTSYKFSEGTQMMASYTRRIQRPRGWELEPFLTWIDANNVRVGNPDLLPELIDSYETGIQTYIGKVSLSVELYHRVTNNKIDRVRSVYPETENVSLNSVINIGKDFSTGSELMMIFDPIEFWNVNAMANLYNYRIEGVLYNQPFERQSFNWNARLNNMFKISQSTQLQINVNYNSPGVSSQGTWKGFFTTDLSVKQDLFEKLLSLTLQIRDLLGTAKFEYSSSGPDFYSYNYFERESPMIMLSAKINFNNYKAKRENGQMDNQNTGNDEF
ncbi:MAG TPA: TonB-dependent receptor [Ignavibacteriaceae bacterium]|nr:TonB-dependent receptor [Ignavibacteriaceae bacterium]HRQ54141.1 TonB-dependent receptor [Ignavibacteriaceae bacterium]